MSEPTLAAAIRGAEYRAMRMGVTLLAEDYARIAEQHHADEKARVRDETLEEAARAIARTGGMASARVIRDLKSQP